MVLITLLVYWPSLNNGFTNWDDVDYVVENSNIKSFSFENVKFQFSNFVMGNYHPVTMISFMLDYRMFNLTPKGYHAVNLLWHVLSSLLVFFMIQKLFKSIYISVIVSLLFAIHPINVESVVWISERKNVLSVFFFLLSLNSYIVYTENKTKRIQLIFTYCFFILSVLSKATSVVLPLVLLIVDYYKNRKINVTTVIEKIPMFCIALLFGIVAIYAQKSAEAIRESYIISGNDFLFVPSFAILNYLYNLIIPIKLSAFYGYSLVSGGVAKVFFYLSPIVILLIGWICFKYFRNSKKVIFAVSFFILNIALLLQVIPYGNIIMADRNVYLAGIGIFIILGALVERFSNSKYLVLLISAIYIIFLCNETRGQISIWKDSITLWTSVIEYDSKVLTSYLNRGKAYEDIGKINEAIMDWESAVSLNPKYIKAQYNLGNARLKAKDYKGAIQNYSEAIKLDPEFTSAYNNRCKAWSLSGTQNKAIDDCSKAIMLDENYIKAYYNRGYAYYLGEEFDKAIQDLSVVLKHENDKDAILLRGNSYYLLQDYNNAINDYKLLIKGYPNFANAYYNLGNLYADIGNNQLAIDNLSIAKALYERQGNQKISMSVQKTIDQLSRK